MRFVIYSGSYSINSLGATKSLCTKLVREIYNLGHDVTWIGRGEFESPEKIECISLSKARVGELLIRVKNKILRTFFGFSPNDISINEFVNYDQIVADKISSGEVLVDGNTYVIGLGGMSLFTFEEAKKLGAKTVLASQFLHPFTHNALLEKEYGKLGSSNPIPQKRIDRQLGEIDIVDQIWIFSDLAEDSFLENGIAKEKLINSPLGVDFNFYNEYPKPEAKAQNQFDILFVGNVNPEKGVHVLLEAALQLKPFNKKINLIFNGNLAPYFKESFDKFERELLAKGVSITVEPGIPVENYMKADLFILPSAHDSFGLVVLEAMASSLPVIVSSKVGAKDCVVEGENGFIFNESDSKGLSELITRFLEDGELTEEFGKKSLELARAYDWKKSMEALVNIILNKLPNG